MTWEKLLTFTPSNDWQCSEPTDKEYFMLRSLNAPIPAAFLVAQVEFNSFNLSLQDLQEVPATSDYVILHLPKSPVMTERRIGVIQTVDHKSKSWGVELWESDYITSTSGTGGGNDGQPIPSTSVELTYASAGDTHGLFYYLGTNKYTETWSNPQTGGRIIATASTILSGQSPIESITDREGSFFHTQSLPNQWVQFTLPGTATFKIKGWSYQARNNNYAYIPERLIVSVMNSSGQLTIVDDKNMSLSPSAWFASNGIENAPITKTIRLTYPGDAYFTIGEIELYGTFYP